MKLLLDTHFFLWILTASSRLRDYPWLRKYQPWCVSPVSLLEIQFLSEIGRLEVHFPALTERLAGDLRFLIDDVPLMDLIQAGLPLTWTRDPFDRMICAHSLARRLPLCTKDGHLMRNHRPICKELRSNHN